MLGLGTYGLGGKTELDPNNDDQNDVALIKEAVDCGLTHIDTAEIYAQGHSEEILAQAIKNIDRQKLFITSKVVNWHLGYDDLVNAAKNSLKRLGLKKLDLYLIHAPNPAISLKETMSAMDYLLENELIGAIGVSNFTTTWIQAAQNYTKYKIVNNQIHYNLTARAYEKNGTLDYCQKNNILITAYRPIGRGMDLDNALLKNLAKKYNKTPAQVALNWVINKPNVVGLVKTASQKHLAENLGAIGWRLLPDDEKSLGQDFPQGETINLYENQKPYH